MRIFRLPQHTIDRFGSSGVDMTLLPLVEHSERTHVNVARVRAGGTLGEHPATAPQVFAVVSGEAVVSSGTGPEQTRLALTSGEAVVWERGEVHQTWATTDVVAVVIEAGVTGGDAVVGLGTPFEEVTDLADRR
ncbi:cupin domain-containing protein [Oerskovia sp. NPDC060287]|uniref:cupin domain-containing protein n=1 Tax=Oerskovia sp. NPDC060287 TaxID=3347095 RepID=UPI00366A0C91